MSKVTYLRSGQVRIWTQAIHAHYHSANLPLNKYLWRSLQGQDLEVRAGLPQTPESRVSSSIFTVGSCGLPFTWAWAGRKSWRRQREERGDQGEGEGVGPAHISCKCCSAPSTALLVLGNPHHKGPIENSVVADMASSPSSLPAQPCASNPDCKEQGYSDPQHRCGRKCKNKQN